MGSEMCIRDRKKILAIKGNRSIITGQEVVFPNDCVYRQRRGYLQDLFLVSMFRIDLDAVSAMIFLRKAYLC